MNVHSLELKRPQDVRFCERILQFAISFAGGLLTVGGVMMLIPLSG